MAYPQGLSYINFIEMIVGQVVLGQSKCSFFNYYRVIRVVEQAIRNTYMYDTVSLLKVLGFSAWYYQFLWNETKVVSKELKKDKLISETDVCKSWLCSLAMI